MSDQHVIRTDYDQMWAELHQLIAAWHDRHEISGRAVVGLLLQYGVTFAYRTRKLYLDQVLDLVRKQWALLEREDDT